MGMTKNSCQAHFCVELRGIPFTWTCPCIKDLRGPFKDPLQGMGTAVSEGRTVSVTMTMTMSMTTAFIYQATTEINQYNNTSELDNGSARRAVRFCDWHITIPDTNWKWQVD